MEQHKPEDFPPLDHSHRFGGPWPGSTWVENKPALVEVSGLVVMGFKEAVLSRESIILIGRILRSGRRSLTM